MELTKLGELKGELEKLSELLKEETRRHARWLIIQRIQEVIRRIGEVGRE